MTHTLKNLLCIMLILLLSLSVLVACGASMKGTYEDDSGRTIEFTSSKDMKFQGIPAEYKISDGTITFVFDSDAANNVQQYSFEKMVHSIVIDGVQYEKVK